LKAQGLSKETFNVKTFIKIIVCRSRKGFPFVRKFDSFALRKARSKSFCLIHINRLFKILD